MSTLHDSKVGDFTRGGQVTIHFLRMIGQVLKKFGLAALMLYSLITVGLWFGQTTAYERYLGTRWCAAWIGVYLENAAEPTQVQLQDGKWVNTTIGALKASPKLQANTWKLVATWLHCMAWSALIASVVLVVVFAWLFKFGTAARKEKHLRGGEILEADELTKHLKREKRAGALKVASVPLIHGTETTHVLLSGSPGTGKSTTIYELMQRIRARGDRCICYSPSGDFIEWFYRAGKDVVLNPFDERCPSWNLWDECSQPFHHDMIANAIVPDPTGGDPFWNTAARTLIASITQAMGDRGNTDLGDFLRILTKLELESLHKYLKGTEAVALVDPASEKTATSIRTTAATYAGKFKYLSTDRERFHIRKWVEEDKGDGWIFLNARPDQIDSVRPVLSAWLEIFSNSLMSLPASRERRVWLIVDELPTLNKIPSLSNFLAQARKYGGCGVLSFQQMSQLKEKYGNEGALALAGLCATWVCMRQNDPETAKWIAQSFGQVEVMESNQGLSYGANDMRDGVSLSAQRKMRDLLLPSEIANLDDLEGYIRLPGQVPAGHFKMKRPPIKAVSPAFIPAIINGPTLEDLDGGGGGLLSDPLADPLAAADAPPPAPSSGGAQAQMAGVLVTDHSSAR